MKNNLLSIFILAAMVLLPGCYEDMNPENDEEISTGMTSELTLEEQRDMIYRHGELRAAEKLKDGSISNYGDYFIFGNVTGIFQREGETLIVSFFGSDDVLDWIANAHFLLVNMPFEGSGPGERIHLGFLYSYNSMREYVIERIDHFSDEGNRRVIVAGHSLGAALATLLSFELALARDDLVLTCFISGSPRVGNPAFARHFNEVIPSCYRYVNRDDLVSQIPTEKMGYLHVGEYHHIGESPDPARQALLLGIDDHFIEKYVKSLDRGLYPDFYSM